MNSNTLNWLITTIMPKVAHNDSATEWQMGMQDSASPVMEGIIDLHHDLLFYMTVILTFVSWLLGRAVYLFYYKNNAIPSKVTHGGVLEIVWTVTPSLVLVAIAIPSFSLLYLMDDVIDPGLTIKVVGHQWYWSYEYSDYVTEDSEAIAFDSYMIPEEDLELGQLRLLEVDNRVVVPVNTQVRLITTSADVIHAWAVPSLGVKIDAYPGRLNQTSFLAKREGVFYGQCSEICGVNHGFMPIVVEAVSLDDYISWVSSQIEVDEDDE